MSLAEKWARYRSGHSCQRLFFVLVLYSMVTPLLWAQERKETLNEQPAKLLSREDAVKKLDLLEKWSKQSGASPRNRIDSHDIKTALDELKNNPEVALPLLQEAIVDKKRDRNFRVNSAELMVQGGFSPSREQAPAFIGVLRNNGDDALIRVYAAQLLLRDKAADNSLKNEILDLADRFLRTGKEKAFVRLGIMPAFVGNSRAVTIMLGELERGSEVGPTLWVLGKIKGKQAVRPISRLLNANFRDRKFPKTRAYLALGEIGGSQAYDLLVGYFSKERDETKRHILLRAIGLTRDPRARGFLLDYLQSKPADYYVSALRGLQYLGDAAVVPVLENERRKTLPPYEMSMLTKTISSITEGRSQPEW